ncbi:non-ribosomal peptide synthetase (plasmid) [Salmonella enterica subsp. enterica serovar Weltevreden]|nr:non-ribosomal peptide synthetase [Salmonella enterica subsp. enterica serovar Weltevreden]
MHMRWLKSTHVMLTTLNVMARLHTWGDPIEVQALKEAFQYKSAQRKRLNRTVLGAVKANLGHTDAASGVAGVIKVVQMLKNEIIPGQTNFSSANVELNLEKNPF